MMHGQKNIKSVKCRCAQKHLDIPVLHAVCCNIGDMRGRN